MREAGAQRPLGPAVAIHLRGVEPADPAVERRLDNFVHLGLLDRGKERRCDEAPTGELHTAQADGGDVDSGAAKLSSGHEAKLHRNETYVSRNEITSLSG
jgi:hypothetical protein